MSEEDVRGGLRDAVAEEPALDFDPDALVVAARHQIRRRRALMAAGAATMAVAVAAVALPVALGRPPAQVEAGQTAPPTIESTTATTTTPTPIDWPPKNVQPVQYTADELRTRGEQMAAHLRQTLPGVLPGVSAIDVGQFGGEATGDFSDGQTYANATVDFTVGGARYSIDIQVWAPGSTNDLLEQACPECQQIGMQDGGPIVASTNSVMGDGRIASVYHLRKDGSAVRVAAYNYQLSGDAKKFAPAIPVTVDQQLTLATDPELGL